MLVIASALLVSAAQLAPTVPPPRDAVARDSPATRVATGIIRGRVTDRESGEPLARVMVMMVSKAVDGEPRPVQRVEGRTEPRITLTGADGRFEFKQTPAGAYVVIFDPTPLRGTHLRQNFGETEPANELSGSRPLPVQLAEGEIRNDVNAALSRALAIEGRVLDEAGDPMTNVQVTIHLWDGPIEVTVGERSTDDRGAYRLFGLKPGQYRICAKPEVYLRVTEDIRERSIPTCYPAASVEAEATPVVLASADVGGIDIRVQHNRAFRISGMAVDAAGTPVERAQINLVSVGKGVSSSNDIETLPGGQFVAHAVTPGDYAIQVEIGSRYNSDDKRERELGHLPIRVDGGDVEGIVVTTTKLTRVVGRIVFEDGTPATGGEPLRVTAETPGNAAGRVSLGPAPSAEVRPDSTFELTDLFGPKIITVTGPRPEWTVKSVKYRDDDVTHVPVEFKTSTDPTALEITLTRRGAVVAGRALDAAGHGTETVYVVLISTDPVRRRVGTAVASSVHPKADGSFLLGPVAPGEYVIVAASGEQMMYVTMSMPETETIERLLHVGERVVLVESEKRSLDVRLSKR